MPRMDSSPLSREMRAAMLARAARHEDLAARWRALVDLLANAGAPCIEPLHRGPGAWPPYSARGSV
jgi:hypothetical protein